jgi:hypothetical protein
MKLLLLEEKDEEVAVSLGRDDQRRVDTVVGFCVSRRTIHARV